MSWAPVHEIVGDSEVHPTAGMCSCGKAPAPGYLMCDDCRARLGLPTVTAKREEAPVSARTVKLRGPLRSCSCGFMTDWPPAMGKHLKANTDHQEVTDAPKPKPEKFDPFESLNRAAKEAKLSFAKQTAKGAPIATPAEVVEPVKTNASVEVKVSAKVVQQHQQDQMRMELIALYLDRLEDRYAYRIEGCNATAHADFLDDIARLRELTEEVAS